MKCVDPLFYSRTFMSQFDQPAISERSTYLTQTLHQLKMHLQMGSHVVMEILIPSVLGFCTKSTRVDSCQATTCVWKSPMSNLHGKLVLRLKET